MEETHAFSLQGKIRGWLVDLRSHFNHRPTRGWLRVLSGTHCCNFRSDKILKLGDYLLGAVYIRNKYSNTLRRLQITIKITAEIISNPSQDYDKT